MKKKILSWVLTFAMLMTMTSFSTFAASTDLQFASSASSVKTGETFTVTLTVPKVSEKSYSASFKVKFDKKVFEVVDFTAPDITGGTKAQSEVTEANAAGAFSCTYDGSVGGNTIDFSAGVTITATLKAKESASIGSSDISVDSDNTYVLKYDEETYSDIELVTVPANLKASVEVVSEITGTQAVEITAPVKGKAAQTSIKETNKYNCSAFTWSPALSEGKFAANTEYTANITLTAKSGYTFASDAAGSVSGATVSGNTVSKDGKTLSFKAKFPKTADKSLTSISVTTNPTTVAVPKSGETAKTVTVTATGNYDDGSIAEITDGTVSLADSSVKGITVNGNKLTVSSEAGEYGNNSKRIAVKVTKGSIQGTAELTLSKEAAAAKTVTIYKGTEAKTTDTLTIPVSGSSEVTYTAKVTDQYGAEMASPSVTWTNSGAKAGVTVNGSKITAAAGATECTVALTATCGSVSKTVNVAVLNKPKHNVAFAKESLEFTYGKGSDAGQQATTTTKAAITYSSSNSDAVAVDASTGKLTIKGAAEGVVITATAAETAEYASNTATYTVKVNKKELTITGLQAVNRAYDTTKNITLSGGKLNGAVSGDDVTVAIPTSGTVASANVGTNLEVTVVKPEISGTAKANYTLKDLDKLTVSISKATPNIGTVTYTGGKIYPSTPVTDVNAALSRENEDVAGTLALDIKSFQTTGTRSYGWTFLPEDADNYEKATGYISLTVEKDTLTGIEVEGTPEKTVYKYGEEFNPKGLTVSASFESGQISKVTDAAEYGDLETGKTTVSVSYTFDGVTKSAAVQGITVNKADSESISPRTINKRYNQGGVFTENFPVTELPEAAISYEITNIVDDDELLTEDPSISSNGVISYELEEQASYTEGQKATFDVVVTMKNYTDVTVKYTINIIDKYIPEVTVENITTVYNGEDVSSALINGSAEFEGSTVAGEFAFKEGQNVKNVADSGYKTVVFTPADESVYAKVEESVYVTIQKATPTGSPAYTAIKEANKTLADAELSVGTFAVDGTIAWVDSEGEVIDNPEEVTVEANQYYPWVFTPEDIANYNTVSGSIKLWTKGGGGGGGGGGVAATYGITVNKAENGTVSTDVSKAIGGATVAVTAKADKGYVLDKVTVTTKSGKAVDVKGSNGNYKFTMPTSDVTVSASFKEEPEIPVVVPTELPFKDVKSTDWYYNSVAYVYSKGIMNGTTEDLFSPEVATTRGMIITMLYRAEGSPAVSGTNNFQDVPKGFYYENAIIWGVEKGLVTGYDAKHYGPEDSVTREQLITILYRYAKFKNMDVSVGEDTNILSYNDATSISDYAVSAFQWGCGAGIINGMDESHLAPQGTATRAQVATMLMRLLG